MTKKKDTKPVLKVKPREEISTEGQKVEAVSARIQQKASSLYSKLNTILTVEMAELRRQLETTTLEDGTKALKIEGQEAQDTASVLVAAPVEALISCLYDFIKPTAVSATNGVPLFFYVQDRINSTIEVAALTAVQDYAQYEPEAAESLLKVFTERGITLPQDVPPEEV